MPYNLDPDKPLFSIGAVAEILGISPRMLRVYEEKGLILPTRSDSNRRQYSLKDIDILSYIQYLSGVKKVNLSGILEIQKILLKMEEKQRVKFMAEVEKEIKALPKAKKEKYFIVEDRIVDTMIQDSEQDAEIKEEIKTIKDKKE